jgi:uncharacterized 2Fe-2S/4Fe-4S cluster protein (DUF4445 family)
MAGEGEFSKHGITSSAANLTEVDEVEQRYGARRGLKDRHRLGCQALICGNLVIDVPPESQVHKQVVRKRAEVRPITLDPVIHLHTVDVAKPDMHDPTGDWQRLQAALADQWELTVESADNRVLQRLQKTLRAGDWQVTVAVRQGHHAVGVYPGYHARALGLAVDVGSTTIAGHLCDLASGEVLASVGRMNPQIRFGEDLMSRVSYIMMHPGAETELTAVVRDAIEDLATTAAREAGVDPADIHEVTIVGNPVMHHLFLGLDPTELGGAPFALTTDAAITTRADELGWTFNPSARVYTLPCIAGHVGADTAAVILSEAPHTTDAMTLIVDVGTNAEIVLGNRKRLLAASSPTGPAFEGAQISCGQRAAPGAIERVRIDRATLEPRFKVIGSDLWSDEEGFVEATAGFGINGVCGSGIIEVIAEMFLAGIIDRDGAFNGALTETSSRVQAEGRSFSYLLHGGEPELRIYQTDVRAIQLAKAALHAGAQLLQDRMGVDHVDRIVLAGAFGSQIDVTYAMVLGMIPDCDLAHVSSAGNAAGTGARIALLNGGARREIEALVRRVEKIETAVEPRFQDHFVAAMAIPHKTAPFPNLAKKMDLPAPQDSTGEQPGRRRRRRR